MGDEGTSTVSPAHTSTRSPLFHLCCTTQLVTMAQESPVLSSASGWEGPDWFHAEGCSGSRQATARQTNAARILARTETAAPHPVIAVAGVGKRRVRPWT